MAKGSVGCKRCEFNCNLYESRVGDFNHKLRTQTAEIEILKSAEKAWKSKFDREEKKRADLESRYHHLETEFFRLLAKVDKPYG